MFKRSQEAELSTKQKFNLCFLRAVFRILEPDPQDPTLFIAQDPDPVNSTADHKHC